MLLQAFAEKKYDKNFARDVLQVSKFETVKACNAVVFGGDGMSPGGPVPFMQKNCAHQIS